MLLLETGVSHRSPCLLLFTLESDVPNVLYLINNKLSDEDIPAVLSALAITPLACIIVTSFEADKLAANFGVPVLFISNNDEAIHVSSELAETIDAPVGLIGAFDSRLSLIHDSQTSVIIP